MGHVLDCFRLTIVVFLCVYDLTRTISTGSLAKGVGTGWLQL